MNYRRQLIFVMALLAGLIFAGQSWAKSWKPLADLRSGGKAKEVAITQKISFVQILVLEGNVIINTIVVRRGSQKKPHTVARKFGPNEAYTLKLSAPGQVTGLRISDGGKGRYLVQYQ